MNYQNTRMLLDKRPNGVPTDDCWKKDTKQITNIKKNEIIIKVSHLSIDPYMRGRMNDSMSYAAPAKLGHPMTGETIGSVVESNSDMYQVGDKVCSHNGWQTYITTKDTDPTLFKVPDSKITDSAYLGVVGMPGRTAYFGLKRVGKPKKGETIVVSAASGAVGSVVGQLAKSYGCKVIGIAGGKEKCEYVKNELGFDYAVDYKSDDFIQNLSDSCEDGIDIYFENVGGNVTKAISPLLNKNSRVPICGFISQYNATNMLEAETPFQILSSHKNKPFHRFFVVTEWFNEWENATKELSELVLNNQLIYRECFKDGIENAPEALRDVLSGKNFGKQIVKI